MKSIDLSSKHLVNKDYFKSLRVNMLLAAIGYVLESLAVITLAQSQMVFKVVKHNIFSSCHKIIEVLV